MSRFSCVFNNNVMCLASDDFSDVRSFLFFSNNLVHVHVHVNVANYLNRNIYDQNFKTWSKPESNSNDFKLEILFSVFSLMFCHIFFKHSWIKHKNIWISYINFSAQFYEILHPFRGLWQYKNLQSITIFYQGIYKHVWYCSNFTFILWPCSIFLNF